MYKVRKRKLMTSVLFGIGVTFFGFPLAIGFPRLANVLLEPGYYLPNSYWGAVHDPLQLLSALVLNVVFWSVIYFLVISLLTARRSFWM